MSSSEFSTLLSALRDINEESNPLQNLKTSKSINLPANAFKKPSCRLLPSLGLQNSTKKKYLNSHGKEDPKRTVKPKKMNIKVNEPEPIPEIEKHNIFDPEVEIKHKRDSNFFGVVERLRNWRPPCLFGQQPDSDKDDSDEEEVTKHISFPDLPQLDQLDFIDQYMDENLAELSEVSTPNIDDLPLPYLDDSLDIEPNMGTLEIWETSTSMEYSSSSKHDSYAD